MRHQRVLRYVDEVARLGSIRKAADRLNLTASALNRRVMDIEEELGTPLFERWPRGVRLTAAGELFVHHLRGQLADTERMRTQIEDLKGLRRGNVRMACSQALAHAVLPGAVAAFRRRHPLVTFTVLVFDHERAMKALMDYEVDVIFVYRPPRLPNFEPLFTLEQRLVTLMSATHPLAERDRVRLSDCALYPLALAERSLGGRQLLDEVAARAKLALRPVIESNSFEFLRAAVAQGDAISFQIELGAIGSEVAALGLITREIDHRDVPKGDLVLGRLRDRTLPVATALFCEQLAATLEPGTPRRRSHAPKSGATHGPRKPITTRPKGARVRDQA
jgi:DNA-binding transcriptional LysR family regulator